VLELELTVLMFVRSLIFDMYIAVLIELMPWFFALDRTHYARWLSVHVRDMQGLQSKYPGLAKEFRAEKFTVCKTDNPFSAMPLDQAHEQNNEMVKGDGGAIGLTENPQALRRWMIGGPQIARRVQEFENVDQPSATGQSKHHELVPSLQAKFNVSVKAMVATITELGNPFSDESKELVSLSSEDVANETVSKTVYKHTDVVVLAIASFPLLHYDELWVAFGTGKNYRYLPCHEYASRMGPSKSRALPMFHAIT
jgi:hypothetical protein